MYGGLGDDGAGLIQLRDVDQIDPQLAVRDPEVAEQNLLRPEVEPQALLEVFQLLLECSLEIDFHQEVGATLKIEAQVDRLVRHPARQAFAIESRQDVRKRIGQAKQQDDQNRHDLPARDLKHARPFVESEEP